jgi:hypothetical protein
VSGHYGVVVAVDLDQADAEIKRRWFVWTAAGLTVHPVTWTDDTDARSLGLRVSRPNAYADIVLYTDGRTDVTVRRPETDAATYETVEVDSIDAFGGLLDRVVELITWSGVRRDHGREDPGLPQRPQRAPHWVLGFDGHRLPIAP